MRIKNFSNELIEYKLFLTEEEENIMWEKFMSTHVFYKKEGIII